MPLPPIVKEILVYLAMELLWPIVKDSVKKHGPAIREAIKENLKAFAFKMWDVVSQAGKLDYRKLLADFQQEFQLELTASQKEQFLKFIEGMESLYQKFPAKNLAEHQTSPASENPCTDDSCRSPNPVLPQTKQAQASCLTCGRPLAANEKECKFCRDYPVSWAQPSHVPQDPFCPRCGSVILEDESACRACGSSRAPKTNGSTISDPKAFFASLAAPGWKAQAAEEGWAVATKETAWSRFFTPTEEEIQAVFVQISRSPCVEQNPDYRNRASQAVFRYLPHRTDINAYAIKKPTGIFEIVFYGGLIVAQRVVAAAVASGDAQSGGRGVLKQPIQQALGIILRAIKNNNRAFHSRTGHALFRHFLTESAMANPGLGCSQAIAQAMHGHVIAHEFGHHFFGHTADEGQASPDTSKMQERQVDAFALQVLDSMAHRDFSHLGSILSILTLAIMHQDASEEGWSHPAPLERLELVFKNREAAVMCEERFGITAELCNRIILELQESKGEDGTEIPDILELK